MLLCSGGIQLCTMDRTTRGGSKRRKEDGEGRRERRGEREAERVGG